MTTDEIRRDITRRRPLYVVEHRRPFYIIRDIKDLDGIEFVADTSMVESALAWAKRENGDESLMLGMWRSMQAGIKRDYCKVWRTGTMSWLGISRRFVGLKAKSTAESDEYTFGWVSWWRYRFVRP